MPVDLTKIRAAIEAGEVQPDIVAALRELAVCLTPQNPGRSRDTDEILFTDDCGSCLGCRLAAMFKEIDDAQRP